MGAENVFHEQAVCGEVEDVAFVRASRSGSPAGLHLNWSNSVCEPNQVVGLADEAITWGGEGFRLRKGAADVGVKNVADRQTSARQQAASYEPCENRGDDDDWDD